MKTQFKYSWQPVYLAAVSDLTARELRAKIATARNLLTTRRRTCEWEERARGRARSYGRAVFASFYRALHEEGPSPRSH
jgi:hypothetical protein